MVGLLECLSLLEDIEGSVGEVVLEVKVLVGQEVVDGLSLDFGEGFVDLPELELVLGDSDVLSEFIFDVFVVIGLKHETFVGGSSSVESDQEGLHERLSSFDVEVQVGGVHDDGDQGRFGEPVEVDGGGSEVQGEESSPEGHEVLSRDQEVFVVWGNLFWSDEIIEELSGLNSRKVDWVMFHVIGVLISLDFWLFDLLLDAVFQFVNLGLELFD